MDKRRTLWTVLAVLFVDMVCQSMAFPALPSLLQEITGGSLQEAAQLYGFMAMAYAMAEFVGGPILGRLSDIHGRKPILLLSTAGSSIAFAVTAFAPTAGVMIGGYAAAGLISALFVVVNATVADCLPPERRATGFAYVGATFGLGFTAGPAIGAMVAPWGLRMPFQLAAVAMALVCIAVAIGARESNESRGKEAFSLRQLSPLPAWRQILHHPLLSRIAITSTLNMLAMQVLIAIWVVSGTYRFGFDVTANGWLLAAVGLTSAIAQATTVPWLVRKLGLKRSIRFGLAMSVISYLGYAFAPNPAWFIGVLVLNTAAAADEPALQSVVSIAADDQQGATMGGMSSLASLMGIVGPPIGSWMFATASGPKAWFEFPGLPFAFGAVCVFIGWLVMLTTLRHFQEPDPQPEPSGGG